MRVFARVRGEMPVKLHLIGDGPERTCVETLIRSLALGNDVKFFGERADLGLLLFRAVGEGEWIEAAGFVVDGA